MLTLGRYWPLYCRVIKISLVLGALGGFGLLGLTLSGLYQGYAELLLAMVIFAPVGVVFLLNGIAVFFYFLLNLQSLLRNPGDSAIGAYVCNLALVASAFLMPGIVFLFLSLRSFFGFMQQV